MKQNSNIGLLTVPNIKKKSMFFYPILLPSCCLKWKSFFSDLPNRDDFLWDLTSTRIPTLPGSVLSSPQATIAIYMHCICIRFERCFNMPPSTMIVSALILSTSRMNAALKCTSEYVPQVFDFFKLIYILLALEQWIYYVSIVFSTYTLSVLSAHLSLMFIFLCTCLVCCTKCRDCLEWRIFHILCLSKKNPL